MQTLLTLSLTPFTPRQLIWHVLLVICLVKIHSPHKSKFNTGIFLVQLKANYVTNEVVITQLGTNSCYINGSPLEKNDTVKLPCGIRSSKFYFLEDKYPHYIAFTSSPKKENGSVSSSATSEKTAAKKKTISDFFKPKGSEQKAKKRVSEEPIPSTASSAKRRKVSESSESDEEEKRRFQKQLQKMNEEFASTAHASGSASTSQVGTLGLTCMASDFCQYTMVFLEYTKSMKAI